MITTSFRRLEVFVEAVEAGSFQACGERLGISQASVSNHILALETQIGKLLFARRRGRSGALTEDGGRTFELAKDLIERARGLCEGSHLAERIRPRRQITIGIHGYLTWIFSRSLAQFVARHPEVNIVVESVSYEAVVEGIGRNKFDLGYFFSLGEPLELESTHIWTEPIGLFAKPDHPLSRLSEVTAANLAEHGFIAVPRKLHLRKLIDRALQQVGVSDFPIAFETEDAALVIEAVRLGTGYACLFRRGVTETMVSSGALCPLAMTLPGLEVRVATPRKLRLDRTVQSLARRLSAHALNDLQAWDTRAMRARPALVS